MDTNEAIQTGIEALPTKPKATRVKIPRLLQRFLPVLATMALAAMLLFAIYFTALEWQWVAFLGGVLFAALLSLVGRASKAEWSIARRTAQLNQLRNRLAQEASSRNRAQVSYHAAEEKMRLMADAMPQMLIYVNAEQRLEFHNRAFRDWIGLRDVQIDGHKMSEVFGPGTYGDLQARVVKALGGERLTFERSHTMANGTPCQLHVAYLPHRAKDGRIAGFLGVLTDITQRVQASTEAGAKPAETAEGEKAATPSVVTAETGGQTLYLNSITQQLTGWSDPEARLRQAFELNEFRLYSQNIVSVDGVPRENFYEIYIRLQEEEDTMAPPGAFIPVAEHLNMTTDLDYWVVRNIINWHRDARKDSAHWHDALYGINLFPATINNPKFGSFLQAELARGEIPPQVLCFEIPEEEAIERPAAVTRLVTELNRLGCRVALGGFGGGGKVSFDTLNHLPVHFLKIDGSVVRDIEANPVSLAKMKAIARVSKAIGVRTVAQFVESMDLLPRLNDLGIDYAQGYGISRPHPIDELIPEAA